jgi:hypothetical protein
MRGTSGGLNKARTMLGERCVSARRGREGEKTDFFSVLIVSVNPVL